MLQSPWIIQLPGPLRKLLQTWFRIRLQNENSLWWWHIPLLLKLRKKYQVHKDLPEHFCQRLHQYSTHRKSGTYKPRKHNSWKSDIPDNCFHIGFPCREKYLPPWQMVHNNTKYFKKGESWQLQRKRNNLPLKHCTQIQRKTGTGALLFSVFYLILSCNRRTPFPIENNLDITALQFLQLLLLIRQSPACLHSMQNRFFLLWLPLNLFVAALVRRNSAFFFYISIIV